MAETNGYFDCNATTPMSPRALRVWSETAGKHWHNPSSLYREAGEARHLLEHFRESLADRLGIDEPDRVIFTSGATEANNAVVRYLAESTPGLLAVSAVEHPCVQAPFESWVSADRIRELPVDPASGAVSEETVTRLLEAGGVSAVSVMAANNETGVLQPWLSLAEQCREAGVLFHTDAAQWIGKLPTDGLGECGFVTGSGHKFGGGKGVGFLVIPDADLAGDFHGFIGGPQEEGRRAGTENLPAIAAMISALAEKEDAFSKDWAAEHAKNRDAFEAEICESPGCRILGDAGERLWNTSLFVLPREKNLKWLTRLSGRGFSVSTGSACSAGKGNPSRVMAAMGLDFEEMGRVLRVSGGWETTSSDWMGLAGALREIADEFQG